MAPRKPRVIIAGAGFAATEVGKRLAGHVDLTMVAPQLRFTYRPLIHELVSEEIYPPECTKPLHAIVENATLIRGRASRIEENNLHLDTGEILPFDKLVLAIGAETNHFGIPGAAEHTLPFWTVADGLHANALLKGVLARLQGGDHDPVVDVVGGGPTGIEVAGELAVFFRRYGIRGTVRVIELMPEIFPRNTKEFRAKIIEEVGRLGIEVLTSTKVKRATADALIVERDGSESELEHDAAFWCAGVRPRSISPLSMQVDATMKSVERDDVYILGDCAGFPRAMAVPKLAQTAADQGPICAHNVLHPTRPKAYRAKVKGIMVSVGPGYAVAELANGTVLAGNVPWHIKRNLYKYKLANA